jgi:hypothetical protein
MRKKLLGACLIWDAFGRFDFGISGKLTDSDTLRRIVWRGFDCWLA